LAFCARKSNESEGIGGAFGHAAARKLEAAAFGVGEFSAAPPLELSAPSFHLVLVQVFVPWKADEGFQDSEGSGGFDHFEAGE
jgi:hypothetical protein